MNTSNDTICAISSATGPADRMIVRISGERCGVILNELTASASAGVQAESGAFLASTARRMKLTFADLRVPATVYTFAGPRSATGEDIVEFHIPGNPLLARLLIDELLTLGTRQAEPGEFTARGYFRGKFDLPQAEAIAALVSAENSAELTAARKLLGGELAKRLRPAMAELADVLALLEAAIDFSEEEIRFISDEQLSQRVESVEVRLTELLDGSHRFERLSHEPRVVLVGRPNAGKSSLLNALAGQERAVVSDVAGTTRDAIWAKVQLGRGMVRLIDVAGIERESDEPEDTDMLSSGGTGWYSNRCGDNEEHRLEYQPVPPRQTVPSECQAVPTSPARSVQTTASDRSSSPSLEAQMQMRAAETIETADVIVLLRDCTDHAPPPEFSRPPTLRVASKIDLGGAPLEGEIAISVRDGRGLDELRARLDAAAFGQAFASDALALNARHVRNIQQALSDLRSTRATIGSGAIELLAADLRRALNQLGDVLGQVTPDDVLGKVFAAFCIGK